ncbi:bifunctional DNA primase/polymerase [Pseudonocardia endophytica]|uniref:Bifunctional DNA primase/polymerase-like protein n=1 Tax=Pseudonocardia endophytica TaxID=401976 RepID=A0A4R1HVJ6_PSEEN|nr:bifunctional DNA primase/polymerase [Pseudonocardia endophytica]TCK25443.1 bifunctional DNA primase/polymerase-like protein [Pseudonocardia endophytica]
MSAATQTRPFADSFEVLWSAGWRGVLPLPPGRKFPPPRGTTGYSAPLPSFADLWAWAEDRPNANVALRMAPGQVALDVDHYGDKRGADTIAEQARRAGVALPATWRLSSRGAGNPSGRYLFRGDGARLVTALPGVEVIQPHHRYSVAAPSRNGADAGRPVQWIDPAGRVASRVPSPAELPELPPEWLALLAASGGDRPEPLSLAEGDWSAWVRALEPGPPCTAVQRRLTAAESAVGGREGGSRFEHARGHVLGLLRLGEMGHHGVREALAHLRAVYVRAVADRADEGMAGGEFDRMRRPEAVGLLLASATPEQRRVCTCEQGITRLLDSIADPGERAEAARMLGVWA